MLNRKNPTPRQISLYTALITAVTVLILLFSLRIVLGKGLLDWWLMPIISIIVFAASYIMTIFFLKRFIYRKIKVIYKSIHDSKRSGNDKLDIDVDEDIIQKVNEDVDEWAEEQKKQIAELKTLETYRKNFLGNISHELKTPIFSIQGYVYTLMEGAIYDEQVNMKYLKKAANGVDRLNTIIQDLDEISKLESQGELHLNLSDFNIKDLAKEVIDDLEINARDKEISILFKEGDGNYIVNADREKIRQVFTNLLINSIKYNKKRGVSKIGFYDMDSFILVEIADNGIGIEKEHIKHLFDRFYRVEKSRSRSEGGSGLGLAIVKHIIEAHKQTVNIRSTKGVGSTFGFTLKKVEGV